MRGRLQRIGKEFEKELQDIKCTRRATIDKNLPREISFERIMDGIPKYPELWNPLKDKLINEPNKELLRRIKKWN